MIVVEIVEIYEMRLSSRKPYQVSAVKFEIILLIVPI